MIFFALILIFPTYFLTRIHLRFTYALLPIHVTHRLYQCFHNVCFSTLTLLLFIFLKHSYSKLHMANTIGPGLGVRDIRLWKTLALMKLDYGVHGYILMIIHLRHSAIMLPLALKIFILLLVIVPVYKRQTLSYSS